MTRTRSHLSVAARLARIGATLGILAGVVQATIGNRIPDWTGNKDSHVGLGLLTVALSASVLVIETRTLRASTVPGPETLTATTLWLAVVALLCSTTVGRLWAIPGALMLAAAGFTLAACGWPSFRAVVATNWLRGLLGVLGLLEILMAISAAAVTTVTAGVVAGGVLIAAAIMCKPSRRSMVIVLLAATLPFVALTWWTIVTPLLSVVALAVALTATRDRDHSTPASSSAQLDRQPVG
jgi:hypothetical protein